jgi:hypothetical protein
MSDKIPPMFYVPDPKAPARSLNQYIPHAVKPIDKLKMPLMIIRS